MADTSLEKAQKEQGRLAVVNNDLEMEILQRRSKAEEDEGRFAKLEKRLEELSQELSKSLATN